MKRLALWADRQPFMWPWCVILVVALLFVGWLQCSDVIVEMMK
jgi:hypothetical protein